MTYRNLIKQLSDIGASAASHEAAEIIRVLAGRPREWCLTNPDSDLPDAVDRALDERRLGVPLQYILGEAWFYGYRFTVSPDCLIPQPDTEHTVALALRYLNDGDHLLDLCTGSGCIAISALNEKPQITATAIDISEKALDIAKANAKLHRVDNRVRFLKADVLSDDLSPHIASANVITSNPPYINTDIIPTLSAEVRHEPMLALDGGDDGMDFYRHFILNLSSHIKNDAVMLLELGYDQSERICALCERADLTCQLHRDFGGNIRVAEIRKKLIIA